MAISLQVVLSSFAATQYREETESWPVGYRYEFGGEWVASIEGNESIAMLIIVFLLVGQFNSIRRPVIILTPITI